MDTRIILHFTFFMEVQVKTLYNLVYEITMNKLLLLQELLNAEIYNPNNYFNIIPHDHDFLEDYQEAIED